MDALPIYCNENSIEDYRGLSQFNIFSRTDNPNHYHCIVLLQMFIVTNSIPIPRHPPPLQNLAIQNAMPKSTILKAFRHLFVDSTTNSFMARNCDVQTKHVVQNMGECVFIVIGLFLCLQGAPTKPLFPNRFCGPIIQDDGYHYEDGEALAYEYTTYTCRHTSVILC